jgi:predicted GNAT superfamily acetyltransferase
VFDVSKPSPVLRPIDSADYTLVLALNEVNVDLLAPLDSDRLSSLVAIADRADVVDVGGEFAGFVITFGPGTTYDSANYRWFTQRLGDSFYYLDRIVLDDAFRRQGLGGFVYDEMERAASSYGRLALEVNLDPPNAASLAFHAARGYQEVGQITNGAKTVALMTKEIG